MSCPFRHGARHGGVPQVDDGICLHHTADQGGTGSSARRGVSGLSRAEETVATRADTVSAWRNRAYIGWRPGGMATVAVSFTVTRGTAI